MKARHASTRFGWASLLLWSLLGLSLEAAHAFKASALLSDELSRMFLRLAHAHGVGLSLVVLAHAATASRYSSGRALRAGAFLIPTGFFFGALAHPEGDPSFGVFLAPIGAVLLLGDLARIAWAACRDEPVDR